MVASRPLKLCLVDMNNGVANQATRCFRRLLDGFSNRLRAANPGIEITLKHVQPRNLGELPPDDVDIAVSSGGPGSPFDGYDDPWCAGYRSWMDHVVERNMAHPLNAPSVLVVCHSFEISVMHLGVARLQAREARKFGVMPQYPTPAGQDSYLFRGFGDRIFAFEHRNWEVVDIDERRCKQLGAVLLARESRDGVSKGRGLTSFHLAAGVDGSIFHPEADRTGVVTWINKPEMAEAFKEAYGEYTYDQMMDTLNDPTRLARTFSLMVPGWLTHRFNLMAPAWGYQRLAQPIQDFSEFSGDEELVQAG